MRKLLKKRPVSQVDVLLQQPLNERRVMNLVDQEPLICEWSVQNQADAPRLRFLDHRFVDFLNRFTQIESHVLLLEGPLHDRVPVLHVTQPVQNDLALDDHVL